MKTLMFLILAVLPLVTGCYGSDDAFEYRETLSLGNDLKSGVMRVAVFYDVPDDDDEDEYIEDEEFETVRWDVETVRKQFARFPKMVLDQCRSVYDEENECERLDLGFHFRLIKDFNEFVVTQNGTRKMGKIGLTYNKTKKVYTFRRTVTEAMAGYSMYRLDIPGNFKVMNSNANTKNGNSQIWEFEGEPDNTPGWIMSVQFRKN